jgi:hypothetical protein
MRRGIEANQHQDHNEDDDTMDDPDQAPLNPSINALQNQVKSLTSQVRVLKRIAMSSLFKSREEMIKFMDDVW